MRGLTVREAEVCRLTPAGVLRSFVRRRREHEELELQLRLSAAGCCAYGGMSACGKRVRVRLLIDGRPLRSCGGHGHQVKRTRSIAGRAGLKVGDPRGPVS